jgi:3-hydroxy-3-methylglutaryl CoA synthase/uncharacterized OB-fold protein
MAGILGAAACVPRYRLPRELIAREWGSQSAGGEKAVANHDEDSLTLAVNAALALPADGPRPDAVFFATTTAPYIEKQAATTIASILDLPAATRTVDFTDTLRAATSAVLAGLDALAGGAHRVLVAAGDCRLGEPDSPAEQSYGDAGVAVLLGPDAGQAEVVATHSLADEFLGTWRTREQEFPRAFPGAFEAKFGYGRVLGEVLKGVLAKAQVRPQDLATLILPTPTPRAPQAIARAFGLDPKKQLQDGFWTTLGDTGTAQPLLMLTAALERARAGDLILLAGYGDGADAILLRATGAAAAAGTSVHRQIETKRLLPSYGRYARFRRLVRKDTAGTGDASSPVIMFRDRKELLPLYGGKCPRCGTVQFPKHRVCIECGHPAGLEDVKLARHGRLFTFTNDYLFESPDPPVTHAVVDLDGGGRLYLQLTDCEPERVEIDMPLELTFRRIHEGGGFCNYFWKARPAP